MAFWTRKKGQPASGSSLEDEAEAVRREFDEDDDDGQAEIAEAEGEYAAAQAQVDALSQVPAVAPCTLERFIEIQTCATHWTMKGLDFEQSLRSYYGLDTVAWLQMNAYWGPRMQDPSILPTYWEVRRATEAKLGAGAPEEPALVSPDAPGPQGLAWARLEQAFGGVDVPVGGDFQVVRVRDDLTQVQSGRTGIVLMLQHQLGVSATGREGYTDSLIAVNQRDAPRFRLVAKSYGKVGMLPAARVDGEFNNGTQFVTRDYVLFPPQMAILLMARGPVQMAGAVQAIADRVAASVVR